MDKEQLLTLFFTKLNDIVLRDEKKLYNKSLLLTLAKINSNKASKYLNDSSVRLLPEHKQLFKQLSDDKLVRVGDTTHNEFVLTAAGIWEYEKRFNGLNENNLIDYIQKKNFSSISIIKGIGDKEKVVLFSLLGIRNFSSSTTMDLNEEMARDYWLDILTDAYDFLLKHRYIKADKNIFAKQGNEHAVPYLMVRVNDLPKATQHIFAYGKARQYYLDVADGEVLSEEKLKVIFRLVFGKIANLSDVDDIFACLANLADEMSKYVRKDFVFIDTSTSLQIKNALRSFFIDEE